MKSAKKREYTYYTKDWQTQRSCECKFCRSEMTQRDYKTYDGICPTCLSMINKH
jgi:uncharacterized CHY-type Zn-finger protein